MTHPKLAVDGWLWRVSVPQGARADLPGTDFRDWGGALRWLASEAPATQIRLAAKAVGGHATLFYGPIPSRDVFTPLPEPLLALHRRLKAALDPDGILNPGRLYEDL
jgi:glycolate oxidase FAD binding subunit